jgi:uncharacterized membrane protein YeaQ/YmgE (transglycosylase-associated protein family)
MEWIWLIIVGAIVGALGRLINPGRDPMGWIVTILLGIVSLIVAGLIFDGFLQFIVGIVVAIVLASRDGDGGDGGTGALPERNCRTYDPDTVRLDDLGLAGRALTASGQRLHLVDNARDGDLATSLARRHTKLCRIGTPERGTEYWLGRGSGPGPPPSDCLAYDPAAVRIEEEGADAFLLTDGRSRMVLVTTRQDADDLLAVARAFSRHCFIGRDNNRPTGATSSSNPGSERRCPRS